MKKQNAAGIMGLAALMFALVAGAQDNAQPVQTGSQALSANSDPQNIKAYIELLRADVRQQKAEMVGEVMQLSAADAAKFWPIYEEYDARIGKAE